MSGLPSRIPQQYPLAIKEIILGWLQDFFQHHPQFPFDPGNERDSAIKIHDKHAFNFESVGDKPAIVLDRKQLRWMNASIDQNLGSFGLRAAQAYMDLIGGTVILHCLSKQGLVAEELGHIVFFGLEAFRTELRKRGLWDINTVGIGEESILVANAGPELVSIPVIASVKLQGKWLRRRASTQQLESFKVSEEP
jgi:hypothetical protein